MEFTFWKEAAGPEETKKETANQLTNKQLQIVNRGCDKQKWMGGTSVMVAKRRPHQDFLIRRMRQT